MKHSPFAHIEAVTAALAALLLVAGPSCAQAQPATDSQTILGAALAALEQEQTSSQALSLAEAVRTAVANNPEVRAKAHLPEQRAEDVPEAAAAYEPDLRASVGFSDRKIPTSRLLDSGKSTAEEDRREGEVGVSKLLGTTGAKVDLSWTSARRRSNSDYDALAPEFKPTLGVNLEQPILKNFGSIAEHTTVLVAKNGSAAALADFESELAGFTLGVVEAYWDQVAAAAALEVHRESLRLAKELVRDARTRADLGVVPPVAVREAEAEAAAREEEVLRAENDLNVAAAVLRHLVMLGGKDGLTALGVQPADIHEVAEAALDRRASLRTALEHRPEIRAASLALDTSRLEERSARNQRLPELNLVGSYTLVGLSGDRVPDRETVYEGSYSDAVDRLFGGDYFDYRIGLRLDVPLSNAAAEARHTRAEIEVKRAARDLQAAISRVALDVERALADVGSAYKRVGASTLARELAEENLRNQRRRFELGAVTTKDVLDFQQKLAQARSAEVAAISDHARAEAELALAQGILLDRFGIALQAPEGSELPWWSNF